MKTGVLFLGTFKRWRGIKFLSQNMGVRRVGVFFEKRVVGYCGFRFNSGGVVQIVLVAVG